MSTRRLLALSVAALLALPLAVAAQEVNREGSDWPKEPRALKFLQREIEIGNLGQLPSIAIPATPRYLVTYMNSQTGGRTRSATVVTVTNQSASTCRVSVAYFKGFTNNSAPVCVTTFSISPDFTVDFCSRNLPTAVTTCNSTCSPELTFDEGRAIVSSTCREIGLSSRVYYTTGANDDEVSAISDSNIVVIGAGNNGD